MSLEDLYSVSKSDIWQGRVDSDRPEERRWHQVVQSLDVKTAINTNQPSVAILGFQCDEGVRRNKGRPGANEGPDAFRAAARHLPYHGNLALFDAGNITCLDQLEAAQEVLQEYVCILLNHGYIPLVVGGGHEIAFPHYGGIRKYLPAGVIGIINFDAHFDLRSDISGLGNSGTSFYQIRQLYRKDGNDYFYCPIGIQKNGNTSHLFSRARNWNVEYILAEDVMFDQPGSLARVSDFMNKVDYLYITVCLDVFQSAVAPGVSAPSAAGIGWSNFFPLLRKVFESRKVVSMDIAELNPRYDLDNRTAKLAAAIAFEMVHLMSISQRV